VKVIPTYISAEVKTEDNFDTAAARISIPDRNYKVNRRLKKNSFTQKYIYVFIDLFLVIRTIKTWNK